MTDTEVEQARKNLGSGDCDACAGLFFTGNLLGTEEHTCELGRLLRAYPGETLVDAARRMVERQSTLCEEVSRLRARRATRLDDLSPEELELISAEANRLLAL